MAELLINYHPAAEHTARLPHFYSASCKQAYIARFLIKVNRGVRQNCNQLSGFTCKLFVLRLAGTFIDCKHLNFRTYPKTQTELSSRIPIYQARDLKWIESISFQPHKSSNYRLRSLIILKKHRITRDDNTGFWIGS